MNFELDYKNNNNDSNINMRNNFLNINEENNDEDFHLTILINNITLTFQQYCDNDINPLNFLKFEIDPEKSYFTHLFYNSSLSFFSRNVELGIEIFEYFLQFPKSSLNNIDFNIFSCLIIDNFPKTLNLLEKYLNKLNFPKFLSSFIINGGLSSLIYFSSQNQFGEVLSTILYFLSNQHFLFPKPIDCFECNLTTHFNEDFEIEDIENSLDDISFSKLFENLIKQNNNIIYQNILKSFLNIVLISNEYHITIANLLVVHFFSFSELDIFEIIKLLSITLKSFHQPPELSFLWKLLPKFIEKSNLELISIICIFFKEMINRFPISFFIDNSFFINYLQKWNELNYSGKEPILSLLCTIIKQNNSLLINSIINIDILNIFFEFLEDISNDLNLTILETLIIIIKELKNININQYFEDKMEIISQFIDSSDFSLSTNSKKLIQILNNKKFREINSIS